MFPCYLKEEWCCHTGDIREILCQPFQGILTPTKGKVQDLHFGFLKSLVIIDAANDSMIKIHQNSALVDSWYIP